MSEFAEIEVSKEKVTRVDELGARVAEAQVDVAGRHRVRMTPSAARQLKRRLAMVRCPYCRRMGLALASGRNLTVVVQCGKCGWSGAPANTATGHTRVFVAAQEDVAPWKKSE